MPHYGHRLCNLLRPVVAVSPDTKGPDHQFCNLSFLATNNNNRDYSYVPSMGQALARSSPPPPNPPCEGLQSRDLHLKGVR